MNLIEKMSAITMEISAVAKNLNVDMGRNSYKAVGEADILAAVKPIEAKYGVYSYPASRRILESAVITTVKKDYETKQQFLRMEVTYRFVNMEKPEEYIEMTTYGDGVDPQDKAVGKAMTYADKYALMKAYKIITGDDPDQYGSEPLKNKELKKAKEAYPDRDTMIAFIKANASPALKARMAEAMKVSRFEDMTDVQIMMFYNKVVAEVEG